MPAGCEILRHGASCKKINPASTSLDRCYEWPVTRAKRRHWSGAPPSSDAEARERILAAALACANRKGLRGTTIADVAKEAGITRPTVYAHFADRHAIFHAAFVEATARLAAGAHAAMRSRRTAGARAIEAVAFFVRALPQDPWLRLTLTDEGLGEFTSRTFLDDVRGLAIAGAILEPMFELAPHLRRTADEVIEVVVRFALSFITVPGPIVRTDASLRAFLRRRMLPAIGLDDG